MKSTTSLSATPLRFDCVKRKRGIQSRIYEETKNMTPEEIQERIRLAGERFWKKVERIRAERAKLSESDGF